MEGEPAYGREINTASEAFLVGSAGQPNYSAAKGYRGADRGRGAWRRPLWGASQRDLSSGAHRHDRRCVRRCHGSGRRSAVGGPRRPVCRFPGLPAAEKINGQVFVVHGGMVALLRPPTVEQRFDTRGSPWTTDELASSVGGYFADRDPDRIFGATEILSLT